MLSISKKEAKYLLKLEKHYLEEKTFQYPYLGKYLKIPLFSSDQKRQFALDIRRCNITLEKNTFQTRTHKSILLARLDMGDRPHRNPDGKEIGSPHIHLYDPNYHDKITYNLPSSFPVTSDPLKMLLAFMDFCCIITKPTITNTLC